MNLFHSDFFYFIAIPKELGPAQISALITKNRGIVLLNSQIFLKNTILDSIEIYANKSGSVQIIVIF